MVNFIFIVTLLIGFLGMTIILVKKIPVLSKLSAEQAAAPGALKNFKKRVRENGTFKKFSGERILHKVLSKIRILTLKTENKTAGWLNRLRRRSLEKSIEKKKNFSDDYWKKLRGGK